MTPVSGGEVVPVDLCMLFEKPEYAGGGEAVGYRDSSRSKRAAQRVDVEVQ